MGLFIVLFVNGIGKLTSNKMLLRSILCFVLVCESFFQDGDSRHGIGCTGSYQNYQKSV